MKTIALLFVMLLAACSPPSSRVLVPPAPCSSWGHLPLVLEIDASAAAYRGDVTRAARAWNDAMGQPAFVWNYVPGAGADIVVALGKLDGDVAQAAHRCTGQRITTVVTLEPQLDDGAAQAFAEHGLGHALGLGHSTNEHSVMNATLDVGLMGRWDEDHDPPLYRIMPHDAALARARHP